MTKWLPSSLWNRQPETGGMFRQAKWFPSFCWGTGQGKMRRKCNSNVENFAKRSTQRTKSDSTVLQNHSRKGLAGCNRLRYIIANGVVLVALSRTSHKIAIYVTTSRHSLMYKRIQPDESGVRLWCYCSHMSQHSWARAPGEEEKDEMWEMSWTFSMRCRVFTWKNG